MPSNESAEIQAIIDKFGAKNTNLVQMLWEIQQKSSYISDNAIMHLAKVMDMPYATIEGIITFYSFFHRTPRGQYDILFSDNVIERFQGKEALMSRLTQKLGVEVGKPRADGRVTVDNTACIGMSDQGPAALVNGYTVTRLTEARIDKMVELIEGQVPLTQWPQEFFAVTSPIQQQNMLLGETFESGAALKVLLKQDVDSALAELDKSGLRGCGGAGFKTASKWSFCRQAAPGDEHYVICNADEGEPGTYKDRVLLQDYADLTFEGMTLCARVIGAKKGFLYLRGEYRYLLNHLQSVLAKRREQGLLGDNILGHADFSFDIEIHLGAGSYVCGAELALIESLEGKRGVPHRKPPPFPVTSGYLRKPTVVNNVETFALASKVFVRGSKDFAACGTDQSKGTKLLSVSGDCEKPGIYEFPFGVTVQEVLEACGAKDVQAVQNSGPAGQCVSPAEFNRRLCFEDLNTTGSFMVFNKSRNMLDIIQNFADFFVHESCGFCTPCRVGTTLVANLVEKIRDGRGSAMDMQELESLSQLIKTTSHCGLGLTATNHIADTLKKFPAIYQERLKETSLTPIFDLDGALEMARQLTHRNDAEAHF